MHTIYIIGAGQMGSRHLQALKNVSTKLSIVVIDPSEASLKQARERYEEMRGNSKRHTISFYKEIPLNKTYVTIAILATNSDQRANAVKKLLALHEVKYLILEKILFNKRSDYFKIEQLIHQKKGKAWVNCSMRTMPFYSNLITKFRSPMQYIVTGSQFGLVTNAIHYIDHIAYLTGCYNYTLDTSLLDGVPIESKRRGFLELNGTLNARFTDGSIGSFSCYPKGSAPIVVSIFSEDYRCISKESDQSVWVAQYDDWKWKSMKAQIPYQSQMTTTVVDEILQKGSCKLPSLTDSIKLHMPLVETLTKFVVKNTKMSLTTYPFT